MRDKKKNFTAVFLIFIFGIMLLFSVPADMRECPETAKEEHCYIEPVTDDLGQQTLADGYVFRRSGIRIQREETVRFHFMRLQLLLLITAAFILAVCRVKAFLLCLKSFLHQMTGFLWKLVILHQKDGKKRNLSIAFLV